jgi:O-antigen biosynthesis alpha-1,3-rhamnosyltransferase
MRVVINASTTIGNMSGVGRHTAELIRCLRTHLTPAELFEYPHGWVRKLRAKWKLSTAPPVPSNNGAHAHWRLPSPKRLAINLARPCGHALLWLYDKSILRCGKFDLYHEPNFMPVRCAVPTIATIHDLSIVRHPEWHPPARVKWFESNLSNALRQACHFFTVTEHARNEMVKLLGVPAERITCTYNGVRDDLAPLPECEYLPVLQRLQLNPGYLLHVGTIEPRKNLLRLMQAYVDLPAALREKHPLVLAGQWGWHFEEIAEYYQTTAKDKGVRQLGFVADADLPALYNGARALVFPTYYEGFGIPAVEMMGCSGAVIASSAEAVAEVVGRNACLIDPEDTEGWRDAMQRVLTDEYWWQSLRGGVEERASRFTWERCAEKTLEVYRRLTGTSIEAPPRAKAA